MNSFLGKTPFFRLLLPVIICILTNSTFPLSNINMIITGILGLIIMLLSIFIKKEHEYGLRWVFGSGVFIFLFSLTHFVYQKQETETQLNLTNEQEANYYIGVITDIPEDKPRSKACNVKTSTPDSKEVIVYLETSDKSDNLQPGDEIVFYTNLETFKNFGNPDDFDYARFMKIRGYSGSGYVPSANWQKTGKQSNSIVCTSQLVRANALQFYRSFNLSDEAYAFISALTLGYKKDLPENLQEAFRASGTAHVLAVSGLHVGIVYIVINIMFSFLGKKGKPYIIRQLFVIIFLWSYAFITGMSASVIRAVIMLTINCVANMKNRRGITINTLSAAAFLILVFSPFTLFDISFQMSFGAVFSILYFQPKLQNLYAPSSKFIKYAWSLFTVSFAAQIGVFPMVLYYFGTFPSYFFITNMLVVPLVGLIIYAVSPLIMLSLPFMTNLIILEPLRLFCQWIVKTLIDFTLQVVYLTESLPFAQLSNINISLLQTFVLLGFIFIFTLWLSHRQSSSLIAALSLGLFFLVTITYNTLQPKPPELVVFNSRDKSDICIFYKNNRQFIDVPLNGILPHHEKTILRLSDNEYEKYYSEIRFDVDILILSENRYFDIESILNNINPSTIVLDSSLPSYCKRNISSKCNSLGIPIHDVSKDGAFSVII